MTFFVVYLNFVLNFVLQFNRNNRQLNMYFIYTYILPEYVVALEKKNFQNTCHNIA